MVSWAPQLLAANKVIGISWRNDQTRAYWDLRSLSLPMDRRFKKRKPIRALWNLSFRTLTTNSNCFRLKFTLWPRESQPSQIFPHPLWATTAALTASSVTLSSKAHRCTLKKKTRNFRDAKRLLITRRLRPITNFTSWKKLMTDSWALITLDSLLKFNRLKIRDVCTCTSPPSAGRRADYWKWKINKIRFVGLTVHQRLQRCLCLQPTQRTETNTNTIKQSGTWRQTPLEMNLTWTSPIEHKPQCWTWMWTPRPSRR